MQRKVKFCALIFFLVIKNCHNVNNDKTPKPRHNFFDTDFLKHIVEENTGNVVVSPTGVKTTLVMLLEAAEGKTASEIRSALRLASHDNELKEQLKKYLQALQTNTTEGALDSVNLMLVTNKLKLNEQYKMKLRPYLTFIQSVDFNDPAPVSNAINALASYSTKGLIQSIIDPSLIAPSTEVFLTNTLFFKRPWKNAFNPLLTTNYCFYKDDVCKMVPMMEMQGELNYYYSDDLRAHAVELPYEGGRYSMIILMPLEKNGADDVIRDLPYVGLQKITKSLEPTELLFWLPKFTVDMKTDLVTSLRKMKITSLFSMNGNLSGIFDGATTHIEEMLQQIYISVDEKGTEAASATSVIGIPLIGGRVTLVVDKPFVFFIKDNKEDIVLFEGKIEDPIVNVVKKTETDSLMFVNRFGEQEEQINLLDAFDQYFSKDDSKLDITNQKNPKTAPQKTLSSESAGLANNPLIGAQRQNFDHSNIDGDTEIIVREGSHIIRQSETVPYNIRPGVKVNSTISTKRPKHWYSDIFG